MAFATPAPAVTVEILVTNIRNDQGDIRVALCSEARFLGDCEHVAQAPARPGETLIRIEVPPGTWAAQAFHDENRDGRINTLLGIPTEGLGFSNDARFRFGPPRFDDAAITIAPPTTPGTVPRIRVPLRYTF